MTDKIKIIYWSGSGNTEKIANLIAEGAGAECACVADISPGDISDCLSVALGSPALGDEGIEETEMGAFISSVSTALKGKKIALFGSYGWGGGEFLRQWRERLTSEGFDVMEELLAVKESPEGEAAEKCLAFGKMLAVKNAK